MTRCKTMFLGLALAVATLTGCTQQCFVTHDDLQAFKDRGGIPGDSLNPATASAGFNESPGIPTRSLNACRSSWVTKHCWVQPVSVATASANPRNMVLQRVMIHPVRTDCSSGRQSTI